MAGYTRQSSLVDGDVITALLFNNEYNQLLAAFNNATGHKHDGTAAEGPVISLIGDAGITTPLNKILVDSTNDNLEFYIDVAGVSTEQFIIQDGAIVPSVDNDIDLGTASLEFKNAYFDGTVNLDALVIGTATAITSVDTDLTSVSASDDTLASAKAIKTYVDAVATVADLDFQANTGGALSVDLDSQIFTLTGGTGIDTVGSGQTVTFNIDDGIVATLTGTQILTNKTLTTPVISSIVNTGTLTLPTLTDTLVGKATTDTFTNKTFNANGTGNSITNLEVADFASGVLDTDLTTVSASDDTLASAKSIKTYVDAQDANIASDTLTFTNKTFNANGTGNSITNLEVADFASGVLDTDLTTVSATDNTLASAKAIKTYVDSAVSTANELSELTDVNITTPADGSVLFYDTATSKWIDNVVSGDITIADTGVAAISSCVIVNADVNASAAIAYSKLNLTNNIVNADINTSAAIDASKLADGSVSNTELQYINSLTSNAQTQLTSLDTLKAPLASPTFTGTVSAPTPTAGDNSTKVATTAFVTNAVALENELSEMNDVAITSVADADFLVYDSVSTKWENQAISGAVTINNTGVSTLSAGIDSAKIADGSVSNTEFQYLDGVTSSIQTQINSKQATIDASNRLSADLIHDGSVDNTEFGYLNGVTSAIQTQIDAKASNGFAIAMAIAL